MSADQDVSLVVAVGQGRLKGTLEENGVRVWRSIPYAAAPVGARRFTAPEPPSTWDGVRDATRFGPICPQPPLAGTAPAEPMDEDCLFLNVWSPHDAPDVPVMVWLHGGATQVAGNLSLRAPVFSYRFRWTNAALMKARLGTPHALDVAFVFGNFQHAGLVNLQGEDAAEIRQLSQTIQTAWLGFARDHVPDVTPLAWPAYDQHDRKVMIIDRNLAVEHDPDADQRRSWGQISPPA